MAAMTPDQILKKKRTAAVPSAYKPVDAGRARQATLAQGTYGSPVQAEASQPMQNQLKPFTPQPPSTSPSFVSGAVQDPTKVKAPDVTAGPQPFYGVTVNGQQAQGTGRPGGFVPFSQVYEANKGTIQRNQQTLADLAAQNVAQAQRSQQALAAGGGNDEAAARDTEAAMRALDLIQNPYGRGALLEETLGTGLSDLDNMLLSAPSGADSALAERGKGLETGLEGSRQEGSRVREEAAASEAKRAAAEEKELARLAQERLDAAEAERLEREKARQMAAARAEQAYLSPFTQADPRQKYMGLAVGPRRSQGGKVDNGDFLAALGQLLRGR